jgi:hypothetical protein
MACPSPNRRPVLSSRDAIMQLQPDRLASNITVQMLEEAMKHHNAPMPLDSSKTPTKAELVQLLQQHLSSQTAHPQRSSALLSTIGRRKGECGT